MNKIVSTTWWETIGLVVVFLLLMGFTHGGFGFLHADICGQHIWRQSDGISIAYRYYQENLSFWTPKFLNEMRSQGMQVGEFPIYYFIAAKLSQISGQFDIYWLRALSVVTMLLGYLALYRLSLSYLKDKVSAFLLTNWWFGANLWVYFGFIFFPDTHSIALGIVGFWFWRNFELSSHNKFLVFAFIFFSLALLLKPITAFPLLVYFGYRLYSMCIGAYPLSKLRNFLILMVLSGLIELSWIVYAHWYSTQYEPMYFTMRLRSIFTLDWTRILEIGYIFHVKWLHEFTSYILFCLWVITHIFSIIYFWKKAKSSAILLIIMSFLYLGLFIMFFEYYHDHDYGLIPYYVPMIGLIGLWLHHKPIRKFPWMGVLIGLMLLKSILNTRNIVMFRYDTSYPWDDEYNTYRGLDTFLDKLPMSRDAKILLPQDKSTCVGLYLAKRGGWTSVFQKHLDENSINYMKSKGLEAILFDKSDTGLLRQYQRLGFKGDTTYQSLILLK
ncbi:MAG: hypothetical protein MUE53_02625 [Chitinophagales bacterium]|jgi:hypothetical protein|nr:hypothetical protein [Chitinophagales bacterium]